MHTTLTWKALFICLALFLSSGIPVVAQDDPSPSDQTKVIPPATTTDDPGIEVDHLQLLLRPLTQEQLLVEVEAWRDLVQAKTKEYCDTDIAIRRTAVSAASNENENESDPVEDKNATVANLTILGEEKSALVRRFNAVIDAYENKGGEVQEFRKYVIAVSEIDVEGADASALWAAFRAWLVSEDGGIKWLRNTVKFLVILIIFWILAAIAGRMVRRATAFKSGMSDLLKNFLNMIVRRLVLLVGLLVAVSTLGVNVSAMLALLGGGAFIIGFALQDSLGNLAAGLMLLIYRPFDVGDTVEVGGVNGNVDSVSLVSTTIRTFDNKVVLVPNSKVWGEVITNATASNRRRVDMIFGIAYDDDADKAQEIMEKVVNDHELVLKDPAPTIKMHELADSSVNFICRPWCKTEDYWTVHWDVMRNVKKEFDANNISIPFPQQDIYLHKVEDSPA